MKILMLTTGSSLMDGINRHILTVGPALQKAGNCKVAVCTVLPEGELNFALKGVGVESFSLNARNGHDVRIVLAFYKLMREFRPDVVHCHVMALLERIVASIFFRKKKYITTIHGISDDEESGSPKRYIENFLNRIFNLPVSYTLYISEGVRDFFLNKSCYSVASEVCYNPISFSNSNHYTSLLRKELCLPENTPLVGTACRLAEVKNPVAFTNVMCQVLQRSQFAHAVVIGDGDKTLKNELYSIVEEFNLNDRFHFLGYRSNASQLISELNCFVLTSYKEGMPTSILESISCRTPFAMMEGEGGLIDIMKLQQSEGPIGIIVPQDDIYGMAQKICNLLDDCDYANYLAKKAYDVGKRHFDVTSVAKQLCNVYQSLCVQ